MTVRWFDWYVTTTSYTMNIIDMNHESMFQHCFCGLYDDMSSNDHVNLAERGIRWGTMKRAFKAHFHSCLRDEWLDMSYHAISLFLIIISVVLMVFVMSIRLYHNARSMLDDVMTNRMSGWNDRQIQNRIKNSERLSFGENFRPYHFS